MYNLEKMEEYKNKIEEDIIKNDYEMKLMYETSWKLPLNLMMSKECLYHFIVRIAIYVECFRYNRFWIQPRISIDLY